MRPRRNKLLLTLLSILVIQALVLSCGFLDEEIADDTEPIPAEEAVRPPTRTPRPVSPNQSTSGDSWLVMFYQNADDQILEKDIYIDLNEAELIGSSENLTLVSQIDRYRGAFKGDGNWTSTKRFYIEQDGDLNAVHSSEIEDLGEADSGDKQTLVDFATWAISTYPADRYALILSDHGAGWTGGWSDNTPVEGSQFTVNDIDTALAEIIANTGINGFELVGFDACLMAHIEPLSAIAPYARYAVASEEVEPSLGWAYHYFLEKLAENPSMDGAELAQHIVDGYIREDIRIVDPDARRAYLEELGVRGDMNPARMADELGGSITLSAIDLSQMGAVNQAFNDLTLALAEENPRKAAKARSYAQAYESIFGGNAPSPFIDMSHFAELLQDQYGANSAVGQSAEGLRQAVGQAVLAEKHGPERPGSNGMAVFFPTSNQFQDFYRAYVKQASRFAGASLWDDYLVNHYTGTAVKPSGADLALLEPQYGQVPDMAQLEESGAEVSEAVVAPGKGEITISPLTVDLEEIPPEGVATISADISGGNIAYIYVYTLYFDEESNSYLSVDLDFLDAGDVKDIGGVIYPDWGTDDPLLLDVEWSPIVSFISDGSQEALAAAEAEVYGVGTEDTTYLVWGTYTFVEDDVTRDAVMRFDAEGNFINLYGFLDDNGQGAPREIIPQVGDQFTVEEKWLEFDNNPDGEIAYYNGDTLTFGSSPMSLVIDGTYTGSYVVGILVEDFDGNTYEQFTTINVTE